jgi:hypothetical protein
MGDEFNPMANDAGATRTKEDSQLLIKWTNADGVALTEKSQTNDISENGISFYLKTPVWLDTHVIITIGSSRLFGRLRILTLALVASLPIALLFLSAPLRQAALAEHDSDRIACSRVYDSVACSCAMGTTVAAEYAPLGVSDEDLALNRTGDDGAIAGRATDGRVVAGSNPQRVVRRVGAGRVPVTMTADFARRVQACMAGGASAPVD